MPEMGPDEVEAYLRRMSDEDLIRLAMFSDMLQGDDIDILVRVMEDRKLKLIEEE